jgi:DNA mismatch repair ATPase MutS
LTPGITNDRHGMMIVRNEGILQIVAPSSANRHSVRSHPADFTVDKQTLDDLNLLGKYKGNSIFNLFDQTHTRGGAQLLESMFLHPLTDAEAINMRSSIFQYFQTKAVKFPLSKEQCDDVEHYMSSAGGASLIGSALFIGRKRLLRDIASDKEYELIHRGILSTIGFMHALNDLFAGLGSGLYDYPYRETLQEVKDIFNSTALKPLLAEHGREKLSFWKVVRYDHLLRHVYREKLRRVMAVAYEIDVYTTVSRVAEERKFSYAYATPFIEGENRIDMINLYHPQVPGAVANSIRTDHMRNMIFLTGANMAGKSTCMKSFGIAVYLAHMGFPVAAEGMIFSVQDGMYTSINVADSLAQGYSHFYAEVLRVRQVAEEISRGKNLVVIFDELFKGTNVKDAYDATVAVTEAFAENRNGSFIVSTHITEAGETLREHCSNMKFVYFPTLMDKGMPRYTYRLQEGISSDRHGMMIIENEGIVEMLSHAHCS